jgi:MFS family permease
MTEASLDRAVAEGAVNRPAPPRTLSPAYVRYALCLMLAIYVVNFLDRQVVSILAEPIKNDLGLADWQIGMMSGFAFAIFYSVLGVPIARAAERGHRPRIISLSLVAWSGFTMLCGTAGSFAQLCVYRICVGVGEAGCTPPAHSLISDYVPKSRRASALAFYSMGVPLGTLIGMAMGGLIADRYGWRAAFLVAGAPGLLLALLSFTTLRETRARLKADAEADRARQPDFRAAMVVLAAKRTFWLIAVAAALKSFITYGQGAFTASFMLRNHTEEIAGLAAGFGLQSVGFLGLTLGLISGICGSVSSILGGWIADRSAAGDVRNIMLAPCLAMLVSVPISISALMVESAALALALGVIPSLLNYFWYGPVYATTQGIVRPELRATAAAVLLFIINLIGLGLGPLLIGALSDLLAGPVGLGPAEGVRWALTASACLGLVASLLFWLARKTVREEMES